MQSRIVSKSLVFSELFVDFSLETPTVPLLREIDNFILGFSELPQNSQNSSELLKTPYPCKFRETSIPLYRENINYIYSIRELLPLLYAKPKTTAILAEWRIA